MKIFLLVLAVLVGFESGWSCDTGADLKGVNERCRDDSECYNGNNKDSVSCTRGVCRCNSGYVAQWQWFTPKDRRMVCNSAPYQYSPCTSICQKPFQCANSSLTGIKTCQCLPPYMDKDGMCSLECGPDQIFEYGECRRRCLHEEVKTPEKGVCKKMGQLGEKCDSKNQCWARFSRCVNGVCACIDGFKPSDRRDACLSDRRACPVGPPTLDRRGNIIPCTVAMRASMSPALLTWPRPPPLELGDNCGPNDFCMLTSGESYYAQGAIGHCCPRPQLTCPYGDPHPNATCGDSIPANIVPRRPDAPYCPYETHSCVRFSAGGGFELSLCCPIACSSQQILSGGQCYPRRDFGDRCQVDDQCKGHTGVCRQGRCGCDRDYVEQGSSSYKYCQRVCGPNQVVANNRCVPKSKLGQPCDPQVYSQCPTNSYCSERKVCECFCGYIQLGDDACGPQPYCPPISPDKSEVSLRLNSLTLCQVPGTKKPSLPFVVNQCPRGQYCSDYLPEYGLCCPAPPKPFCPDGAMAGKKCDPKAANPCGILGYCYRYLNPAGQDDSNDEYVCCQINPAPVPMPVSPNNTLPPPPTPIP